MDGIGRGRLMLVSMATAALSSMPRGETMSVSAGDVAPTVGTLKNVTKHQNHVSRSARPQDKGKRRRQARGRRR